ncbi:transglutaminase domain-containing protein [Nocardioides sp. zg-1228]|uniref:transglutaminase domain-containing protein n=1 Tax=Nocardioides sp. zg-1228 TaxID=2763008 RepID=UPI001642E127|nr:transglutaminase domain-containing protein [Nocardioides sp. zg-1228]MBC2934441.1 transglutaminase domain-containing protein [Nocardioides sp. zg-1228]QSF59205.1 transglutaminase domain-containing protein [Nocardioides sp. zg-1228]
MRTRQGGVADALVVVVVCATILSILDDTFADRSYLVAGLVPVVLLAGLALVTRRVHEGGWWYSLVALAAAVPVAAWAALREPGPWLVPTLRTASRVIVDSVHAPTTLVSTVPPVEAAGQVMLVPFLVGFLAALPAAWLAVASTRPLAPVVPLLAALAATIPLGVLAPTLLVPRAVLIGVVLLGWAAVRARRSESSAHGARGSGASAVSAVLTVVLVSGLAALVVPDADDPDRVLLRGRNDTPFVADTRVLPAARTQDIRLFRARGVPEGRRLRLAALDLYTGTAWVPADSSPGSDGYGTFKRIGSDVSALHPGATEVVRVRFRPGYSSDWLPMLGELTSIDFAFNPGRTDVGDVRYNQATASALVLGGVDVRDEYRFESVLGEVDFTRRDATREPTDEQRQRAGAFPDPYLRPFARDDLLPLERVLLLARYLRTQGTVRVAEEFDQSPDMLGRRMLGSQRMSGTPFQYSALMALGASRLGVAARVVTGAEPDRRGLVDYGDLTTWVELQFADGTWRPLDLERYLSTRVVQDPTVAPPPATDPAQFVERELDQAARGTDGEIDPPPVPVERTPGWQVAAAGAAVVLGAGLLGLLLVPLVKVLRRARRRRTPSWSALYVGGWQEVLDAARDRGTPVPEGWSRLAQARQLGVAPDLARRADAAVFAPVAPPAEDGREFWDACQVVRRRLVAEAGRRRRWWSHLNPASLLASRARARGSRSARQVRHEDRRARRQQPADA